MLTDLRTGFHSLQAGGLNWDALPLRLFDKGNRKFWNPSDIDFSQDARDATEMTDDERRSTAILCSMFVAGEEAVAVDIQPFLAAMNAEGRFGDAMYLTQFCFEEAKHTQGFRLWLDAVGLTDDLSKHVENNPGYRRIFYEELPASLRVLGGDPGPANQVRAAVTYNHVVEGTLALTGYHAWNKICRTQGVFPGMQELIGRIGDDERRHMAWGTFTCRRHVASEDTNWQVIQDRMGELLPHALTAVQWVWSQFDEMPMGLDVDEFVQYAANHAQRRLGAIESARGKSVEGIDLDYSPEALEDQLASEDRATLG